MTTVPHVTGNKAFQIGEMMSKEEIETLESHSRMLGRIASLVEDFAKNEEDTTLLCVLRLLQEYHYTKAESLQSYIDRELSESDKND